MLLLIEEISEEGSRTAFAGHLRSFLAVLPQVDTVVDLFKLAKDSTSQTTRNLASQALAQQRLLPRDAINSSDWGKCDDLLREWAGHEKSGLRGAALVIGWYRRRPWDDSELAVMATRVAPQ